MANLVLILAILAAVLVMGCGIWVAVVLIAAVTRVKPPASASTGDPVADKTIP